jgi:hypothetical protein
MKQINKILSKSLILWGLSIVLLLKHEVKCNFSGKGSFSHHVGREAFGFDKQKVNDSKCNYLAIECTQSSTEGKFSQNGKDK